MGYMRVFGNIRDNFRDTSSIDCQSFLAHLSTCSRGAFRVVRCPSCVVNNFFKHLLLPNRWANLDQTWQECSLGGPLKKLFTEFDSIKNSGCHGNEIEFFKQFFKNLHLWNRRSDFEIIPQKCSLGDPFQKLFAKFWSVENMALVNGCFCTKQTWRNSLKIFFSETPGQILK